MKRISTFIVCLFLIVAALFAQQPSQQSQPQPQASGLTKYVSPEQLTELQKMLNQVQQTLDQQVAGGDGHKTVGDVMDKGLDMFKNAIVFVAGKIEQVAPQLWRVLLVQQYVKGVQIILPPLGFLLLIFVSRKTLLKWWPKDADDDNPEATPWGTDTPLTRKGTRGLFIVALPIFLFIVGGVWLYQSLTEATGYFVNPYYYALKDLVLLVRNPGAL